MAVQIDEAGSEVAVAGIDAGGVAGGLDFSRRFHGCDPAVVRENRTML